MAKDYIGRLVCLKCIGGELEKQLTDEYLDKVDNQLMEENVYKNINREMFYENPKNLYMPQIGDETYFTFQGYEETIGFYPYHFITSEKERNKPIDDFFSVLLAESNLQNYNALTHKQIKCKIVGLRYQLPSATTYEMNQKLDTGNHEFSIQTELDLVVIEPEEVKDVEFTILFFNSDSLTANISINYLIPSDNLDRFITLDE